MEDRMAAFTSSIWSTGQQPSAPQCRLCCRHAARVAGERFQHVRRRGRALRWQALTSASTGLVEDSGGGESVDPKEADEDPPRFANGRWKPDRIDRSIMKVSLPALGALSLDPLVALADTAVIGHLGARALAGVGISNNVFNLAFTCFNFLAMATTPVIARAFGRNDKRGASILIAHTLWIALAIGLTATFLLCAFTLPIVRFFGAGETVAPLAAGYLRARIVAAPSYLAIMVLQGAFRGHQDTSTPFVIGILANCVNLVLCPLLAMGLRLGVVGAGLATSAGQLTASFGLLTMLLRKKMLDVSDLRKAPPVRKILPLARTGLVLSVRTISILSTVSFATTTAARMGTAQIAAFEITRQLWSLCARLFDALSVTAQSLIPVELGREDFETARTIALRLLILGFCMGCVFFAVMSFGAGPLSRLFSNDPAVSALVAACLPVMALMEPLNGVVFVLDGCFTAGRQFPYLAGAILGANVIASSYLLGVRALALPVQHVWIGLNIMMVFRATFLGVRFISGKGPVQDPRASRKQAD